MCTHAFKDSTEGEVLPIGQGHDSIDGEEVHTCA